MKAKIKKSPKLFHTSKTKVGSGDFYGEGYKNPTGESKEIMGTKVSRMKTNEKKGKPPRSLA